MSGIHIARDFAIKVGFTNIDTTTTRRELKRYTKNALNVLLPYHNTWRERYKLPPMIYPIQQWEHLRKVIIGLAQVGFSTSYLASLLGISQASFRNYFWHSLQNGFHDSPENKTTPRYASVISMIEAFCKNKGVIVDGLRDLSVMLEEPKKGQVK